MSFHDLSIADPSTQPALGALVPDANTRVIRLPSGQLRPFPRSMPQAEVDDAVSRAIDEEIAAKASGGIRGALRGLSKQVAEATTGAATGLLSLPSIVAGGLRGELPSRESLEQGTPGSIARTVVPQTPGGQAVALTAGPLARLAPLKGLSSMLNVPLRVGGSAVAGAGGELATGGSVYEGAKEGAVAGLTGEAVRGVVRTIQLRRGLMTRDQRLQTMEGDAQATLEGIHNSSPTLGGMVAGPNPMDSLRRIAAFGEKEASATFGKIDDLVVNILGGPNTPVKIPSLRKTQTVSGAPNTPGYQSFSKPGTRTTQRDPTIKEALQEIKEAGAAARRAPKDAEGFKAREYSRKVREEFLDALGRPGDPLRAVYERASQRYFQELRIVDVLRNSGALIPETRKGMGSTYDLPKLMDYMSKNMDEYGEQVMPKLWQSMLQGAQPGAAPVSRQMNPFRVYAGQGVSTMGPRVSVQTEPLGGTRPFPPPGPFPAVGTIVGGQAWEGLSR